MLGFKIVRHSLAMVFGNFTEALRIGAVPIIGLSAFSFITGFVVAKNADRGHLVAWILPVMIMAVVLAVIIFPWVAVAWHRFILRGERPTGFLPSWSRGHTWGYIKKSLLLAAVALALIALAILAASLVFRGGPQAPGAPVGRALVAVVGLLVYYLFLRFSLVLPAIALGEPAYFSQSWEETGQIKGAIIVAAITLGVANGLEGIAVRYIPLIPLAQVIDTIWGWAFTMVGISTLTTVYGYLFEERPL